MHSLLIIVLVVPLAIASTVQATPITFAFTGDVDSVIDWSHLIYPDLVNEASVFSGRFTFESTTPNATPDSPWEAHYEGTVTHFEGQVGALSFSDDYPPDNMIIVVNDVPSGWRRLDEYVIGATVQLYDLPTEFTFGLEDLSATALDSLALPELPPTLTAFDNQNLRFGVGGQVSIYGHVNTFTLVPEPGGPAMIGFGATALVARRGRRNR